MSLTQVMLGAISGAGRGGVPESPKALGTLGADHPHNTATD